MEGVYMPEPLCLIENRDSSFVVNKDTIALISKITTPVVIVSIVGPFRTGKSYLLTRLMGKNKGFPLGNAVEAKTKGIWIWCRPHPLDKNLTLVLLDTEGLGDIKKGSKNNDIRLFALAVLLSSTLVYNNMGTLNNDAVEKLSFVAELTKVIKVRSATAEEDGEDFFQFFPDFVWAIRDFTLELTLDGKPATADEYLRNSLKYKKGVGKNISDYNLPRQCIQSYFRSLKCFVFDRPVKNKEMFKMLEKLTDDQLDPEFLGVAEEFYQYIINNSMRKSYQGKSLNGSTLCVLAETYVNAINSGNVPCVEDTYTTMTRIENQKALAEGFAVYGNIKNDLSLPAANLDVLSALHEKHRKAAIETFLRKAFGDEDGEVQLQLIVKTEALYNEILAKNDAESEKLCKAILQKEGKTLEENLMQGKYMKPGGYQIYCEDKQAVVEAYQMTPGKGTQAEDVLKGFLMSKEIEGRNIMQADQQMTDKQKELAAQREANERAEHEACAAKEEQRKAEQRFKEEKETYEQNLRLLEEKRKEEQKQVQKEQDLLVELQLEKQKALFLQGCKEEAAEMKEKAEQLKRQLQENKSTYNFMDFLADATKVFVPIAGSLMELYSKRPKAK